MTQIVRWLNEPQNLQRIAHHLPEGYDAQRLQRSVAALLHRDQQNGGKLSGCDPVSLLTVVANCAHLGLDLDLSEVHIIPRGREATMLIDYRGLIKLAKRSGQVIEVEADVVRENDEFRIMRGTHDRGLEHYHAPLNKRGDIVGAYALFHMASGVTKFEVLEMHDIEAIRSKAAKGSPAWRDFFGEMVKKSAIRRGIKTLELTSEDRRHLIESDRVEFAFNQSTMLTAEQLNKQFAPSTDGATSHEEAAAPLAGAEFLLEQPSPDDADATEASK
jgi:recombination protein RecT